MTRPQLSRKELGNRRINGHDNLRRALDLRKAMPADVLTAAARGESVSRRDVVDLIKAGNALFRGTMAQSSMSVDEKLSGIFAFCCDARPPRAVNALALAGYRTLHGTIAANVVTSRLFRRPGDLFRAVISHEPACGGVEAACAHYKGTPETDVDVLALFNAVTRNVAETREEQATKRSIVNLSHQKGRISDDVSQEVHEARVTIDPFDDGSAIQWMSTPVSPMDSAMASMMEFDALSVMQYSASEGVDPNPHSALMAVVYDSTDLGHFNNPGLFTLLMCPRELFTVTEVGPMGLASLKYAISHGGAGHVDGIGHSEGRTGLVGVIASTAEKVHAKVKKILGDPELNTATRNGETIVPMRYDAETLELHFLE